MSLFLLHRIERMEKDIFFLNASLVIIDSLASIVRREFTGNDSTVLHDRAMFLSKTSYRLKMMAELLNISVIKNYDIF